MSSDASRKARHEFRKSPPGKAGFRISGHLLGGCPPMFDQLQKRLAATAQAVALLQFIDEFDRLARQLEQHFFPALRAKARTVEAVFLGWIGSFRHR